MELKRRTRPSLEYFVVVTVVICTLWLSIAIYAKRDQLYKEKLLMQELATMRAIVTAYILEHRTHPNDKWIIEDPFGHSYSYNLHTGWVSSTTFGYQSW